MRTIEILGKKYTIEHKTTKELDGAYGKCDVPAGKIMINSEVTKEQHEDTLLHEAIHIISDELLLELEERQVGILATALYSLGVKLDEKIL